MPAIFYYLLKLSISLSVVFLFYQLVLRKLTFYNWNRWYLVGYTLLSFFIPFINISPVLEKNEWSSNTLVNWVPVIRDGNTGLVRSHSFSIDAWTILFLVLVAGMLFMLVRLVAQLISFRRMKQKAVQLSDGNMKLYQVDADIIPFSFGNSIFINQHLHTEQELQEIIRHEFVHVKQKHSLDILWSELLLLLNWYNPFCWLLKKAIRQNLEFVADNQVLQHGINKKDYQYLLLKVIGNSQFSIANQFNFSSLKKRIAMMNKMKSTKRQLLRLLFLLPATAILLLAFRNRHNDKLAITLSNAKHDKKVVVAGLVVDANTLQPLAGVSIFCKKANTTVVTDEKGYYKLYVPFSNEELRFEMELSKDGYAGINQNEHWGNFYNDGIYDAYGHTIELFALSKNGKDAYSAIAGHASDESGLSYERVARRIPQIKNEINGVYNPNDTVPVPPPPPPPPPPVAKLPSNVKTITIENGKAIVTLKDGKKEYYNLNNASEKAAFDKKYPAPPPPPPPGSATGASAGDGDAVGAGASVAPVAASENDLPVAISNSPRASVNIKAVSVNGEAVAVSDSRAVTVTGHPINRTTAAVRTGVRENQPFATIADDPLYVVDGTIASKASVDRIDPVYISRVNILKGADAIKAYGNKAKDGVVIVYTKEAPVSVTDVKATSIESDVTAVKSTDLRLTSPSLYMNNVAKLVLLDGKEMTGLKGEVKLNGNYKIVTLSKEEAVKKYGDKGKNGAIEFTTVK